MKIKKHKKTPDEIINLWLLYAQKREWSKMVDLVQLTWAGLLRKEKAAKIIAANYDFFIIESWKILAENKKAECLHHYIVEVKTQLGKYIMIPNIICETAPFKPSLLGVWGINPLSAMFKSESLNKNSKDKYSWRLRNKEDL